MGMVVGEDGGDGVGWAGLARSHGVWKESARSSSVWAATGRGALCGTLVPACSLSSPGRWLPPPLSGLGQRGQRRGGAADGMEADRASWRKLRPGRV